VSQAFEETIEPPTPLLGLQRDSKALEALGGGRLSFHYSKGRGSARVATASASHGGFDNDPATMNHVLETVLGTSRVPRRFTEETLAY